jgi:hypothetical protein
VRTCAGFEPDQARRQPAEEFKNLRTPQCAIFDRRHSRCGPRVAAEPMHFVDA